MSELSSTGLLWSCLYHYWKMENASLIKNQIAHFFVHAPLIAEGEKLIKVKALSTW